MRNLALALAVVVTACSGGAGPAATTTRAPTTSTIATTTSSSTTTSMAATTSTMVPESSPYAVVAWEDGGRLEVLGLDPQPLPCAERDPPCGPLTSLGQVEVPPGPHNTAALGELALTTHPREGVVSRYDAATGEVSVAKVGAEPHDVDFSSDGSRAYITDESGRRLAVLDPATVVLTEEIALPGEPHDLAVLDGEIWVTMIGRSELARVREGEVSLHEVGGAPHDIQADGSGRLWLTHWGSARLTVFDPATGAAEDDASGIAEPHHFALGPEGHVWISDNGAAAVVGLVPEGPVSIEVGPVPHHLSFLGDLLVVAVSGTGQAVVIRDGAVEGRVPIGQGLHGVATGTVKGAVVIP